MIILVILLLLLSPSVLAQSIGDHGIVNNASYVVYGNRNYGIAQGSIFAIFGTNLGPPSLVSVASFPLEKVLGGTSVRVTSGGVTVDAFPLYTVAGQVGALLPSNTPVGTASVVVSYNGQTSAPVETVVVSQNLAAFAQSQAGTGPAVITNYTSATSQPVNTPMQPARPGQVVTIWGTGLGAVSGREEGGPLPGELQTPINVQVAGYAAKVLYHGRSGCCAGLDQINIEVPPNVEGCYLPIFLQSGISPAEIPDRVALEGSGTELTTIAVTRDGAPCSDPFGLNASEWASLQTRGTIRAGWAWVRNSAAGAEAGVRFAQFDSASMAARLGIFGLPSPVGQCLVSAVEVGGITWPVPRSLDAGASLTVTGAGTSLTLSRNSDGSYTAQGGTLAPGPYTLSNGAGGADVGAFSAAFSVPPPLGWTNSSDVRLGATYVPTWNGGDPNGFVIADSRMHNNRTYFWNRCDSPASAGRMQYGPDTLNPIRSDVMGLLWRGVFGAFVLEASLSSLTPVRFTAPGLDIGLIGATFFQKQTLTVR